MTDDILTLAEVAEYLKISDKTLLKMVANKEIPCAKIANQWRFSRTMIDNWITSRMEVIPKNELSRLIEEESDFLPLSRLIDKENIILPLKATTREEVLDEMAERAGQSGLITNTESFKQQLHEREQMTSTAIGNGVAIPHIRKTSAKEVLRPKIVIGISNKGIDFGSFDNSDTFIFFLLVSDSEIVHLKVLSRLGQIFKNPKTTEQLKKIKTKEDMVSFFIEKENTKK